MSIGWAGAFCPDKNYPWWCWFSTTHTTMRILSQRLPQQEAVWTPNHWFIFPTHPRNTHRYEFYKRHCAKSKGEKKAKQSYKKTNCERRHLNSRDSIFQKCQSWTVVQTILGFWFTFVGCGNVYIISPQWNQWSPYQISGHLRLGYVRLITHNLWYQSFAFIWTEDFGESWCLEGVELVLGFSHLRWVPQNAFVLEHPSRNQVSKALMTHPETIWRNHKKPWKPCRSHLKAH